jgi:hypothetical protein
VGRAEGVAGITADAFFQDIGGLAAVDLSDLPDGLFPGKFNIPAVDQALSARDAGIPVENFSDIRRFHGIYKYINSELLKKPFVRYQSVAIRALAEVCGPAVAFERR